MIIYVLVDKSHNEHGGRETFYNSFYNSNKNYKFIEIYTKGKIGQNSTNKNVSLIHINKFDVNIINSNDIVYSNIYLGDEKNLELLSNIKKKEPTIIQQQHESIQKYNDKDYSSIDFLSCYTKEDESSFTGKVKTFNSLINSFPAKGKRGNAGLLYSGRDIYKIIKKTYSISGGRDLTINVPSITSRTMKFCKKRGVKVVIGQPQYDTFTYLIQIDKKGYGMSAIEAMSIGVPTLFLNNYPSYSYITVSDNQIFRNLREMKKFLKNDDNTNYDKLTLKYNKLFAKCNKELLNKIIQIGNKEKGALG